MNITLGLWNSTPGRILCSRRPDPSETITTWPFSRNLTAKRLSLSGLSSHSALPSEADKRSSTRKPNNIQQPGSLTQRTARTELGPAPPPPQSGEGVEVDPEGSNLFPRRFAGCSLGRASPLEQVESQLDATNLISQDLALSPLSAETFYL